LDRTEQPFVFRTERPSVLRTNNNSNQRTKYLIARANARQDLQPDETKAKICFFLPSSQSLLWHLGAPILLIQKAVPSHRIRKNRSFFVVVDEDNDDEDSIRQQRSSYS
jgi:hypothetical protein